MTRVLITGGAGYVGSALVPSLLEKGFNVIVYDLYLYGEVFQKYKGHPGLLEVKADIRDRSALLEASRGCDAMIHLACISNDPSYDLDPKLGKSINYDAFFNIIDAMKKNRIRRLIYASSSSVYGIKEQNDVTEDATLEPLTDYSRFKVACEKALADLKDCPFEYVVVRPATVCGYAPRLRLDVVVNILVMNALVNKKIKIFGGDQLRPNINIKDMVRVYELLLEAPKEKIHGQIFNAGYQNYPVRRIAQIVKEACEDPSIEFEVVPTDDNRSYHINSDKIRRVLGFENRFTIQDAVQSLVDAWKKGLINDPLNNPMYHNIKRMKEVKLT